MSTGQCDDYGVDDMGQEYDFDQRDEYEDDKYCLDRDDYDEEGAYEDWTYECEIAMPTFWQRARWWWTARKHHIRMIIDKRYRDHINRLK